MNPQQKEKAMALSKEDVLEALGIERSGNWIGIALAGFGIGCVVGAAAAMLLAPKPGAELRQDLMDRGRDLMNRTRSAMGREASPTTPPTNPIGSNY
jgi:YtxH-like protein